jgi:hypothetical protein
MKSKDFASIIVLSSFPELIPVFGFDLLFAWLECKLADALGEL